MICQKNRGGESIIEFMNQVKLVGEKIRQLELDSGGQDCVGEYL
jgi:hypothetical protein